MEAVFERFFRNDPRAFEDDDAFFTERELQGDARRRKQMRTMKDLGESLPEVPHDFRMRSRYIEWSLDRVGEGEQEETDEIIDMDPGNPLLAVTERSTGKQLVRHPHERVSAAFLAEDDADSRMDEANPFLFDRFRECFPFDADVAEKILGRRKRTVLGERLMAIVSVDTDG